LQQKKKKRKSNTHTTNTIPSNKRKIRFETPKCSAESIQSQKNTAIYSNAIKKEKNTFRKRRDGKKRRCNRSSDNENEDSGEEEE